MMNSKGFGKFESLTILVGIIILLAVGMYAILGMGNSTKYKTLNDNASKFAEIVGGNGDAFVYNREYYLDQAYDDGLIKSLGNPFGKGTCDLYESKVRFDSPEYYVTLKCGDYIIYNKNSKDEHYKVFKTGEWSTNKTNDNDQEATLYSCDGCGVDGNYEEVAFVHLYNKNNSTNYNQIGEVSSSVKLNKTVMYRTLELVVEK